MRQKNPDIYNKALVALNVIVFFILELLGDTEDAIFMYEHGAMFPIEVLETGQWYRLFTCMFLHFGIRHLGNNMVVLFFLGDNLERALGHVKYVVLYVLAGLCGSLLSAWMMLRSGAYAVSAGASGAIFGVMGGLIYVLIRNHGRLEDLTAKRLVFMAALSLYLGFTSTGVDNYAHLGGLLSGLALAVLLYRKKRYNRTSD